MKLKLNLRSLFLTSIAFCIFLLPVTVHAQKVLATLNHVAICTTDLKKTTDFYTTVLGLKVIKHPFNDTVHRWFNIGPGLQMHAIQAGCPVTVHDSNTHLSFSVLSITDYIKHLDALNISYNNFGHEPNKIQLRADGVKQIYFQDPNGYWIEVNDAK